MVPTKGLALPFLSYGGTSLITTLAAIGILLNVSRSLPGELR
jgi:cell division protein FtsW